MLRSASTGWIFFDLGSTLWDESEAASKRLADLAAHVEGGPHEVSVAELEALIEKHHLCHSPNPVRAALREAIADETLLRDALRQTRYAHELIRPYPDAEPVLAALHGVYRLGIIANQPPGIPARLQALGWDRWFDVVLGSGDVGLEKPSAAIFERALEAADTRASDSIYVGDRIDNDIVPAKALGFGTIRYLGGFARVQTPRGPAETADVTVSTLSDILTHLL
ncbi:MAG: HAD family hydrolase [Gammaproteobacteria bacterium]|nr:HAD family hydrolase [Gammaproteobacteria bacterium]